MHDDFAGVVVCANRDGGFDDYDDDVLLALGDHAGAVLHNERLRGELRTSYVATVSMLSDAIAAKDPFVGGHSEEVSAYVSAVAERLGVEQRRREELLFGSLLHDLGKIGISERILLKPAGLSPEERAIVELHPRIGYKLVSRIPRLEPIALAVLHHHERLGRHGLPAPPPGEAQLGEPPGSHQAVDQRSLRRPPGDRLVTTRSEASAGRTVNAPVASATGGATSGPRNAQSTAVRLAMFTTSAAARRTSARAGAAQGAARRTAMCSGRPSMVAEAPSASPPVPADEVGWV
jgi:hypothetical protein